MSTDGEDAFNALVRVAVFGHCALVIWKIFWKRIDNGGCAFEGSKCISALLIILAFAARGAMQVFFLFRRGLPPALGNNSEALHHPI